MGIRDKIILTIDDGPSMHCGALLDYLTEHGIGAILFCQGNRLKEHWEVAIRAIKDGFVIGNHSFNHPHFRDDLKMEVEARTQIIDTDKLIDDVYSASATERPAKFFRYPYGEKGPHDKANQRLLHELGYRSPLSESHIDWLWDVMVEDWHVTNANIGDKLNTAKQRLAVLQPGNVLDMHDLPENLVLGLFQSICEYILERGFVFCSNEDLAPLTKPDYRLHHD